jgi:hypothetical protein
VTTKWITSGGGPYLCTTTSAAALWKGTDGLSLPVDTDAYRNFDRSKLVRGFENTDYGWAGVHGDFAWKLPSQMNDIMIINDLPYALAWHSLGPDRGLIVKWIGAESETQVAEHLSTLDDADYEALPFNIEFSEHEIAMFDSAWRLQDVRDNKIIFDVDPGTYSVRNRIYQPDQSLELHILKLERE